MEDNNLNYITVKDFQNLATGIGDMGEYFIKSNIESINTVHFAKTREDAKIPSKRLEDAGMDVYACFDEDYIILRPHETKIIPTGIHSAFSSEYFVMLKERGSTGSKGMAIRMGIIDSGYRGEWLVGITNTTDGYLFISKISEKEIDELYNINGMPYRKTFYPYSKAICQAIILPVPKLELKEISLNELKSIESDRGFGAFGSSGK